MGLTGWPATTRVSEPQQNKAGGSGHTCELVLYALKVRRVLLEPLAAAVLRPDALRGAWRGWSSADGRLGCGVGGFVFGVELHARHCGSKKAALRFLYRRGVHVVLRL